MRAAMPDAVMNDARRYLLGDATDEQRAAIEDRFFESAPVGDAIDAEEDRLIEDYLAGDLSDAERDRFERHYLASPLHRRRLAVVRGLARAATRSHARAYRWLAAAAVLLLTVGGVWMLAPKSPPPASAPVAAARPAPQEPPPAAPSARPPSVFAFALSPINVRSNNESRALVIPAGTDVVTLDLQSEGAAPRAIGAEATIATVDGRRVWSGAATTVGLARGVLARIDVPAALLAPDDYFVEIAGYRYFLRVRAA